MLLLTGCEHGRVSGIGGNGSKGLFSEGSGVDGGAGDGSTGEGDVPGLFGLSVSSNGENNNDGSNEGGIGSWTDVPGDSPKEIVNPEPGSLLLFGTGLLGSALSRSRLKRFLNRKKT